MSWTNAVITDAGHALQAALLGTGKGLVFTRAVSGAGLAAGDLAAQTAVTDARQELTMQPAVPLEDAKTRVQAMLSNDGLEAGYTMHQLGFYAKAQDGADEILYALVQDEAGDPIPAAAENPGFTADWTYIFAYGNADSVTVTVDPAGVVPWSAVGAPNGVAPLDENGKVPKEYLGVQGYQVGDILTTVRTDLDDSWLLCNGADISRAQYPKLAKFFPDDILFAPVRRYISSYNEKSLGTYWGGFGDAVYVDGRYVVAGLCRDSSDNVHLYIEYAAELEGPWESKVLYTLNDVAIPTEGWATRFIYANGYYLILWFWSSNSSTDYINLTYSDRIDGTWITEQVATGKKYSTYYHDHAGAHDMMYHDGKYIIVGNTKNVASGSAAIWVKESLDDPSWKTIYPWQTASPNHPYERVTSISFDEKKGRYLICGMGRRFGSSDTKAYSIAAYAEDLEGTWTLFGPAILYGTCYGVQRVGDYYVLIENSNGDPNMYIYDPDALDTPLTSYSLRSKLYTNENGFVSVPDVQGQYLQSLYYFNGTYFVLGTINGHYLHEGTSPYDHLVLMHTKDIVNGLWSFVDLGAVGNDAVRRNCRMACLNSNYMTFDMTSAEDSSKKNYPVLPYVDANSIILPKISIPGCYNYIKAKEDNA